MAMLTDEEQKRRRRLNILLECIKKAKDDPVIESSLGHLEMLYILKYERNNDEPQ